MPSCHPAPSLSECTPAHPAVSPQGEDTGDAGRMSCLPSHPARLLLYSLKGDALQAGFVLKLVRITNNVLALGELTLEEAPHWGP